MYPQSVHWKRRIGGQHYPRSRNAADDLHLAAAARARRLGGLAFPRPRPRKTNPRPTMRHGRGFWNSLPGINGPNANRLILRPGRLHRGVPSNLVMRRPVSSSGSIQPACARICSSLSVSEHKCRAPQVLDLPLSLASHLTAARRPMPLRWGGRPLREAPHNVPTPQVPYQALARESLMAW